MTVTATLAMFLAAAAAANLSAIGAGVIFARSAATPARPYGAAFAFIAAAAVAVIAGGNIADAGLASLMEQAETMLTLAAGPVFYLLVCALCARQVRADIAVLPAVGAGIVIIALGFAAGPDIRAAVAVQMGYSVAAAAAAFREPPSAASLKLVRIARALIAGVAAVHVAQAARMIAPGAEWLMPAVPVVIAFVAFGLVACFSSALASGLRSRVAGNAPRISARLLHELMMRDEACLDPDYRLADLAVAAGVSPQAVSKAINDQTGNGFVAFVNRARLRHAHALLLSPEEARTSVEAIALLSGFRSRSAFYRAFSEEFGMTPAACRKANVS